MAKRISLHEKGTVWDESSTYAKIFFLRPQRCEIRTALWCGCMPHRGSQITLYSILRPGAHYFTKTTFEYNLLSLAIFKVHAFTEQKKIACQRRNVRWVLSISWVFKATMWWRESSQGFPWCTSIGTGSGSEKKLWTLWQLGARGVTILSQSQSGNSCNKMLTDQKQESAHLREVFMNSECRYVHTYVGTP